MTPVERTPGQSEAVASSLVAYGTTQGKIRLAHSDSIAAADSHGIVPLTREEREAALDVTLAPGATRGFGAGTREREEAPDPYRICFEKDLDRIKHSRPFRRLAGKCQVFLAPDDIHLRNRLTHAIEVAQVALAVGRRIGLNLTLIEAMALGHDCGHGPAGHASEDAFSAYCPGGYDHAVYGANVTLHGLNLCSETLDGIRQHSWRLAAPKTPEGEVLSWADRIAYLAHDADDAIRAGVIRAEELPAIVLERCGQRQSKQIGSFIDAMVAATAQSGQIGMIEELAVALDEFRKFNYERIYLRPAAARQGEQVIALLSALVEFYAGAPGRIPDVASGQIDFPISDSEEAFAAAVFYVSGMTDRFALTAAQQMLGWSADALPRAV